MTTVTSHTVAIGGIPSITPRSTATSTTAVSTRCLSTAYLVRPFAQLLCRQSEAPLARTEGRQRRFELRQVEIRPQHVTDEDLGVGEIPQQEIADTEIATGADEQIGIGHV